MKMEVEMKMKAGSTRSYIEYHRLSISIPRILSVVHGVVENISLLHDCIEPLRIPEDAG
jgi:hypothetical protein